MEIASIILVFLLATLVQYIVDILKNAIPATAIGKVTLAPIYSLIVGIALAIIFQVDIMAALGFATQYAIAGWIITGLIVSGGSSAVHELIAKLRESRTGGTNT
jgi:hypothetical protein